MASFLLSHFSYVLFPQLLSWGNEDVPVLLAEVTQAWDTTAIAEAARVTAMLTAEISAQETVVARDSAALRVKDVQDWATLAEGEALERVSRAEAENAMMLASVCEETEGPWAVWEITLLEDELAAERRACEVSEREHREQFEELTLL
jgi:hypothetical protein